MGKRLPTPEGHGTLQGEEYMLGEAGVSSGGASWWREPSSSLLHPGKKSLRVWLVWGACLAPLVQAELCLPKIHTLKP